MVFTEKFATDLEERRHKLTLAQEDGLTINASIWRYLQDSENQFITLMQSTTPPPPDAPGNIEYGWCLYFLNGKITTIPLSIQLILTQIQSILKGLGMPDSKITKTQWRQWMSRLQGEGVLTGDGTLVSTAHYALIDPGWALSLLDYFLIQLKWINIVTFNSISKAIHVPAQDKLRIALFGDWGTGAYQDGHLAASPSQLVMQQISAQKPDIAIHLGDVYYSGTRGLFGPKTGEEYTKLVACWDYKAPLGNFTLNSNHEMYDGGNGLFNVALNNSITSLFQAQGNSTFFSISFNNWLILGLDSAYNASQFYMNGVINDPAQQKLLKDAGSSGKRIVILTHHNPLNETGTAKNSLWTNVVAGLGVDPAYWYWGHVHNGIVYSAISAGGDVRCRCLGNAAIPIGNASWFRDVPQISFYTNSPLDDTDPKNKLRIKNGFALLEFTADAINEQWYYHDGSPAWSSTMV